MLIIYSSSHLVQTTFKKHFGEIKVSILEEAGYLKNAAYKKATENTDKIINKYYANQKPNFELFNENFNTLLKSLSKYFSEFGLNFKHEELSK
jgi:hypothetical protein